MPVRIVACRPAYQKFFKIFKNDSGELLEIIITLLSYIIQPKSQHIIKSFTYNPDRT